MPTDPRRSDQSLSEDQRRQEARRSRNASCLNGCAEIHITGICGCAGLRAATLGDAGKGQAGEGYRSTRQAGSPDD